MTPFLFNIKASKSDRPLRHEYKPPDERNPDAERLLQAMMREQGEQWRIQNEVQWQRAIMPEDDIGGYPALQMLKRPPHLVKDRERLREERKQEYKSALGVLGYGYHACGACMGDGWILGLKNRLVNCKECKGTGGGVYLLNADAIDDELPDADEVVNPRCGRVDNRVLRSGSGDSRNRLERGADNA